ncbi:hypothetical protein TELCIR_20346, partial [Teladorsagia circumcincta]
WLVKMAMDSKASRAEYLKSYIDYQYNKTCRKDSATAAGDSEAAYKIKLEEAEKNLRELETQLKVKEQELAEAEADYAAALRKEKEVEEIYKRFTPEEIEEARTLMAEVEAMKKREQEFKDDAEAELEAIRQEILAYEHPEEITEEQVREMEEKLAADRLRLAEVNQRLAQLSYELDKIPTQIEMAQYQKRLIELYNEMGSRNRQTKQYITLHNTLLDVRNYLKKDIEMLSKIEEVLPL